MALRLVTPADDLPVTVAQVKEHLRVDITDDDTLISLMIIAATEMAEQRTGRAIMPQVWEMTLDAFPESIALTSVPVRSVTSVTYVDANGAAQTLSSTLYTLNTSDDYGPASITPVYDTLWPVTRDQINAVTVRYAAGYADEDYVPESIKAWIKLMVGAMYSNRESESVGRGAPVTLGFADRLLDRYKVWSA